MGQNNIGIQKLVKKIIDKRAKIMVVGLGQVGLPTALACLESGYNVIGYDVNKNLVGRIKSGVSPVPEADIGMLMKKHLKASTFAPTSDSTAIVGANVVIICVATPLSKSRTQVDLKSLCEAVVTVGRNIVDTKLIIVESTIPPRTMGDFVIPKLEAISNKKSGSDFLVSFCPERISPGSALPEFLKNDRLIGAEDYASLHTTYEFLSRITSGKVYETDTTTAEISKLAENSFRDVNIAFANELALICESNCVDVLRVIDLANTHPRVNIHTPGPGVGGPCLPKDPYLLVSNFRAKNSLIRHARLINDQMPEHVVSLLLKHIHKKGNLSRGLGVLILGSSYKPNVNDTRNSPTEKIVSKLRENGIVNLKVHDPYTEETFGAKRAGDLYHSLSNSKCVITATAHSEYASLRPRMFRKDCILVDAVRILKKSEFIKAGMNYISIGI